MRIKFWGVRGSIPTPLTTDQLQSRLTRALSGARGLNLADPAEVQAYIASLPPEVRSIVGGNTTCVEVDTGDATLIVDCGSGMRALGLSLMARGFGMGTGVAHIFMTHAHWDHLQGFPFFAPAFVPGNRLIFYAVGTNPSKYLNHQQSAPAYFPIPPRELPAKMEFVQLHSGQAVQVGRTRVTHLALYHPGTAYAYRFENGDSTFVFASDGEYKLLDDDSLSPYLRFFAGADALAFDAQYSLRDVFMSKADWGHSSSLIGVDIAERAGVKRLITVHHDPSHSDEQVRQIGQAAAEYAQMNQHSGAVEVIVGYDGLELYLGEPLGLSVREDRSGEVWTISMSGRLDASTAAQAHARLHELLEEAELGPVVVDLDQITVHDAVGVNALLEAARQVPRAELAWLAGAYGVRRALALSGAESVAAVFRTRREAMAALAGRARWLRGGPALGGRYALKQMLTTDAWGVVYAGKDLGSDEAVAVHMVSGDVHQPDRTRFDELATRWLKLDHAGLLAGRAVLREADWTAYIGEWTAGQSLREWLGSRPGFHARVECAVSLCEAMAHLHGQGAVHGEFSPECVVMSDERARISHSPLFRNRDGLALDATHAPEQLRGQPPSAAADVYALGTVLYELLLGARPFVSENEDLIILLKLQGEPQSPLLRWPDIPEDLHAFLLKLLAADPHERFPTAIQALSTLQAMLPEVLRARASSAPDGA